MLRAGILARRGLRAEVLLVGGLTDRAVDAVALVLIESTPVWSGRAVSLLIQSSLVALNVWLAGAMGLSIPVVAWCLVWPQAKLVALVPVSLGGLGVRQVAMAGLLAPLAVEPPLVVAQSLVWESLLVGPGVVGGAVSIWLPGSRSVSMPAEVSD